MVAWQGLEDALERKKRPATIWGVSPFVYPADPAHLHLCADKLHVVRTGKKPLEGACLALSAPQQGGLPRDPAHLSSGCGLRGGPPGSDRPAGQVPGHPVSSSQPCPSVRNRSPLTEITQVRMFPFCFPGIQPSDSSLLREYGSKDTNIKGGR